MIIPDPIKDGISARGGIEGIVKNLPDETIIAQQCRIHHALSMPVRMTILYMVLIQPMCVCIIKDILHISDSKLSYHLSKLSEAGLIKGKRQGSWIIYYPTELARGLYSNEVCHPAADDGSDGHGVMR
ncbi:MAG: metalloregulator ArsR/SmtB family transcription factor [Euryarchaeota archaeon]|nr:metalloregulator ArsR/SmtB family transcription factor [Euryarchaeota archaeon]